MKSGDTTDKTYEPSLPLSRDPSAKVDWAELSTKLLDAIEKFVVLNPLGGVAALISSTKSIKIDATPQEKLWSLSILSFAWTLDELARFSETDPRDLRQLMDSLVTQAKSLVDSGSEFAPMDFLQRPTRLPDLSEGAAAPGRAAGLR